MRILLSLLFLFVATVNFAQEAQVYSIFNSKGKEVEYSEMVNNLKNANVVFFGELHNNPIAHWLELRVAKSLFDATKNNLIIGMEMFEADNQLILDEYLNGIIAEKNFEQECKLWPNYQTDYKPMLEFAKANNIKLVATNVPRRYAALVNKKDFEGLDLLSVEAKKFIAPLPIDFDSTLECYSYMIENMKMMGHTGINIAKAQALKDATMAYFIYKNFEEGKIFYHINGSYHSDNHQSILWYLKKKDKNLKIQTISVVSQKDISQLEEENKNLADFIIVVCDDMITTY